MSLQTRLFVGNLPQNVNESELCSAFTYFGKITNFDLKSKSASEDDTKKFAFITLSASNYDIEKCIKHFTSEDFKGCRLYVTRARESFLERLQREREQTKKENTTKFDHKEVIPKGNPVIKLDEKLNPRKRKFSFDKLHTQIPNIAKDEEGFRYSKSNKHHNINGISNPESINTDTSVVEVDKKKHDSDKKRLESIRKKRQEFKQKQNIIRTGLISIDSQLNKKVIFSDSEDDINQNEATVARLIQDTEAIQQNIHKKNTLFDEHNETDEEELNFEIKEQFEGEKGRKVLDLQSRYKYDKRFILDERFIEEDSKIEHIEAEERGDLNKCVDIGQDDEKTKQLNILQEVLGVEIKPPSMEPLKESKKLKPKLGMVRFDPTNPEHNKFLAPVEETKQASRNKAKKILQKEKKNGESRTERQEKEISKVEVSKEQFYKVSETLKESIAQPTSFSLRSLFANDTKQSDEETEQQSEQYLVSHQISKKPKVKNPLDPGEKNPFVYDSSDSDTEENDRETKEAPSSNENNVQIVWKETLFFTKKDKRLKEGLVFFTKPIENEVQKERRELKSLMKKRIHNKERKNQMFQKKIGGRKKTMKKSFRRKY